MMTDDHTVIIQRRFPVQCGQFAWRNSTRHESVHSGGAYSIATAMLNTHCFAFPTLLRSTPELLTGAVRASEFSTAFQVHSRRFLLSALLEKLEPCLSREV